MNYKDLVSVNVGSDSIDVKLDIGAREMRTIDGNGLFQAVIGLSRQTHYYKVNVFGYSIHSEDVEEFIDTCKQQNLIVNFI